MAPFFRKMNETSISRDDFPQLNRLDGASPHHATHNGQSPHGRPQQPESQYRDEHSIAFGEAARASFGEKRPIPQFDDYANAQIHAMGFLKGKERNFTSHHDEEKWGNRQSSLNYVIFTSFLILSTVLGWFSYRWLSIPGDQPPPMILAEETPYKVRPENPGGIVIPHQDKLVYGRIMPEQQQTVEHLLPQPENPIAVQGVEEVYPPYQQQRIYDQQGRQGGVQPQQMQPYGGGYHQEQYVDPQTQQAYASPHQGTPLQGGIQEGQIQGEAQQQGVLSQQQAYYGEQSPYGTQGYPDQQGYPPSSTIQAPQTPVTAPVYDQGLMQQSLQTQPLQAQQVQVQPMPQQQPQQQQEMVQQETVNQPHFNHVQQTVPALQKSQEPQQVQVPQRQVAPTIEENPVDKEDEIAKAALDNLISDELAGRPPKTSAVVQKTTQESIKAPSATVGPYRLQVASFSGENEAKTEVHRLRNLDPSLFTDRKFIIQKSTSGGVAGPKKTVYKVMIGFFSTANGATQFKSKLKNHRVNGIVVKSKSEEMKTR